MEKQYLPDPETQEKCAEDYGYLQEMIDLKQKPMPHFSGPDGERSFLDNIDASEMVLNGYTLSRADQGKEEWQSNLLDNVSRAKLRAIAAGVGLKVPDMRFRATNNNGLQSAYRAQVLKSINRHTFTTENPTLENFQEVWQRISHGVTFSYEGYQTGGAKRKIIDSFDSVTGKVKYTEKYVRFSGKPISVLLNPQEFYWWDFFISNIQEQKRLAWVQHYGKYEIEVEFSKYPNYKYLKDKKGVQTTNTQETTYFTKWGSRVQDEDDYEVFRLYSIPDDVYRVWINGVLIVDAPMLWGEKKKYYPFASTILEPYANTNFLVGLPLGQLLEAYQDGKNTILNTIVDKLYRSVNPKKLIGLANKDLFDVQNLIEDEDDRLYVPDISQVRFENPPNINSGELNMLSIMDRGIEQVSISSASQGIPQKNVTATADQIAAARAAEIKSNLYIYSEDLWLQKVKLRNQTILTHYMKDVATQEYMKDRIIYVYDYTFGDQSRGTLGIHIAKGKSDILPLQEIEAREKMAEQQGENLKIISLPKDYLDEWQCDVEIVPESLHAQDRARDASELDQLVQWLGLIYPEFLAANRDKFLEEKLSLIGRNIGQYNPPAPPTEQALSGPLAQGEQQSSQQPSQPIIPNTLPT